MQKKDNKTDHIHAELQKYVLIFSRPREKNKATAHKEKVRGKIKNI